MPLRLSYTPYRLLFKHPFETSHGVRDGTDSIFIRLEDQGVVGYGEVTLPPYLEEKPLAVIERLRSIPYTSLAGLDTCLALLNDGRAWSSREQGCRAGLYLAWIDVVSRKKQLTVVQALNIAQIKKSRSMVTLGITPVAEVETMLQGLPESDLLKVKMNGPASIPMLEAILKADPRPVFIDANQGLNSLREADELQLCAGERLVAMEQPFNLANNNLQKAFQQKTSAIIYGDESIQGLKDLEQAQAWFKGVNIKLMKCGGLDRAKAMAERADELGMQVMLGSMSESSLGCTAMAHLAGQADLVDLDGPWLVKNDPFEGIAMRNGKLVMPDRPGIGAVLKAELVFNPICA